MNSLGADFSKWDARPVDYSLAREKIDFVFIKASEGTVEDSLFRAQWGAAEGWVLRSAYHFFRPSVDPVLSARKLVDIMGSDRGDIPVALDLEVTDGRSDTLPRARVWLLEYEAKTGIRPIVYSSPNFLNSEDARLFPWLREYPLWLAQYYYDNLSNELRSTWLDRILSGAVTPNYPAAVLPWTRSPEFWQFTAIGRPRDIPGYYTGTGSKLEIDLNFYVSTREALLSRYGRPDRPSNGDMPNMPYAYSITPTGSAGLKVRKDHYVVNSPISNQVGSIAFGRFGFGNEKWIAPAAGPGYLAGDTWLKVESVDGSALVGWVAEIHNGERVGSIQTIQIGEPKPGLEATVSTIVSSPGYKSQTVTNTVTLEPE